MTQQHLKNKIPLVSICCITYNHEQYIRDAIDGFLMQNTDFPFEICLGEDESNDGTREICQEYADKFPDKVRLFLRSRKDVIYINGQATGRYNIIETLKECKGEYIALCDGDDYWTDPLKLQKQVAFLEANKEYSFSCSEVLIQGNNGEILDKFPYFKKGHEKNIFELEDYLFYPFSIFHTSTLVMKNYGDTLIDKLSKYSIGDFAMTVFLLNQGKGYMFNEKFSVYRIHGGGIWSNGLITPSIDKIKIKIKDYEKVKVDYPSTIKSIRSIKKQLFNELANKYAEKGNITRSLYYYGLGLFSSSDYLDKSWFERLVYNLWLYKDGITRN